MFGFHKRNRSLIPVKGIDALEASEKQMLILQEDELDLGSEDDYTTEEQLEEEKQSGHHHTPRSFRNMIMIYLLFLAEAIMASSLSTQIMVLVPSATGCVDMDVSFLRSVLQCAYFLGSATGVFWGFMADRLGRRTVAMVGMAGMGACCLAMGFATSLPGFTALRFLAGINSSAVTVSALAMLADSTHGSEERIKAVAALPAVALGGSIGPLAAQIMRCVGERANVGVFARFPGLGSQLACASFVLSIGLAEIFLLRETLPEPESKAIEREDYDDCEKATFLGQRHSNDSSDSLNISIIEALKDTTANPSPSYLSISQLLSAPSVLILLASYAILSLHSSTFEVLLPQLAHTASHQSGLEMPCEMITYVVIAMEIFVAFFVLANVPVAVSRSGILPMYRRTSLLFPVLYILIPLLSLAAYAAKTSLDASGYDPKVPFALASSGAKASYLLFGLTSIFDCIAVVAQTMFSCFAQVFVLLLVLNAAPDASSTGSVIGVVSISEIFKALAVGASGVSFYLADGYSVAVVNGSLWAALAAVATIDAAVTWKLKESPRIGTDYPEECLVWEDMFDAHSDEESGF